MSAPNDALAVAIVNRWSDAGLDSTIGTTSLYAGGDASRTFAEASREQRVRGGAPPTETLPRAEYTILQPNMESKSRGSRVNVYPVRFQVWHDNDQSARQAADSIADQFINAESAGTNPIAMDSSVGAILGVEDGGALGAIKEDDYTWRAIQQVDIRVREINSIPS